MLPAKARLTRRADFQSTVRHGRRCGSRTLVVHFLPEPDSASQSAAGSKIGFVVSKAVGNAVTRNRVKRRLRHLAGEHLAPRHLAISEPVLPPGCYVIRANPAAAGATQQRLRDDLEFCLMKLTRAAA